MKWVWRGLLGLVLVIVLLLAGGFLWLRTGLPELSGSIRLPGITAPVQIIRDANDVPHIFAASDEDAYFALGYVHASDRLWQMDLQRAIGAGRLAERVGEAGVRADRFMRVLGLYRYAEASYRTMPPEVRRALDSYTAGVNAWLDTHSGALPPEFAVLRYAPEPWRPADTIVWGRLIALQLSGNLREEVLRARLAAAGLDPARLAELFPSNNGPPTTLAAPAAPAPGTPGHAAPGRALLDGAALDRLWAALPPPTGPATASNEWVVSGSLTETGKPILANDPHLGLAAPILWYLVRIETPTLSVAGATVPGEPFVVLGHNARIAWGCTTTESDTQDLFIEQLDPADPSRYLTPAGSEPFRTRTETIRIGRDGGTETLTVRETRHGPVLSDVSPEHAAFLGEGRVVALAWPALTPADINVEAAYRLNRAGTWEEFRAAMRQWRAPQQNITYADVAGNIGLFVPGDIPIRAAGDGSAPVPGWTDDYAWTGFIPFEALPQALNPPAGRLINANNAVVGPDYPYFISRFPEESYRAQRIAEALDQGAGRSVAATAALQMDTVSLAARDLLPLMLAVRTDEPRAVAALDLLRRWDYRMDRDRPEPLIWSMWLLQLSRTLYGNILGNLFQDYLAVHDLNLCPTVVRRMLAENHRWCGPAAGADAAAPCQEALRASLAAALDALSVRFGDRPERWRWGDAHIAPLPHQVFQRIPVIDRLVDLAIETDGGPFTVNRGATAITDEANPFAHVHGATLRAVYDLADLAKSQFIITTGQSGNPLSPYYGNFVRPWRDGAHFPIAGTPAELAAHSLGTFTLVPATLLPAERPPS